jgi:two-component sensor histidine kinase
MAAGFSEDITERKEAEQRRLESLEGQRDALVREVSHRIKNSLQGATGLLRRAATAQPQLAPALAEVAAQLQGLATVHGLMARTASGRIELCALLRGIAAAAESLGLARIEVVIPPHCDPCLVVAEKDAVPLALAVNELVMNAVKHVKPGGKARIAVEADLAAGAAEIRIVNAGRLPPDIRAASGGSGLELVRMLLPPKGARFELAEAAGKVTATLRLKAPVVQPGG